MTARRGTTNGNQRGSSYARAARRAYLLATYAANVQVIQYVLRDGAEGFHHPENTHQQASMMARLENPEGIDWTANVVSHQLLATCRCYRCGALLVDGTLTVDRIIPGVRGGTYRRDNIRPACGGCNSETGGALARRKK